MFSSILSSPMLVKMMNELRNSTDEQHVALQMSRMLKEPKIYILKAVVKYIPRNITIDVLEQTIEC